MKKILNMGEKLVFKLADFYKKNIAFILFLAILFGASVFIRRLPYFNIIPFYNYYVALIFLSILVIFFRRKLSTARFFIIIEGLVIVALLAELLSLHEVLSALGFIVFSLVVGAVLIGVVTNRKELKSFRND